MVSATIHEPPAQVQVVTAFVHLVEFPALVRRAAGGDFLPDILELFVAQPSPTFNPEPLPAPDPPGGRVVGRW